MTVVFLQAEMVDTSVCYEKSNVRTFTMGESLLGGFDPGWLNLGLVCRNWVLTVPEGPDVNCKYTNCFK